MLVSMPFVVLGLRVSHNCAQITIIMFSGRKNNIYLFIINGRMYLACLFRFCFPKFRIIVFVWCCLVRIAAHPVRTLAKIVCVHLIFIKYQITPNRIHWCMHLYCMIPNEIKRERERERENICLTTKCWCRPSIWSLRRAHFSILLLFFFYLCVFFSLILFLYREMKENKI